jgi:hypothetical protein
MGEGNDEFGLLLLYEGRKGGAQLLYNFVLDEEQVFFA